MNQIESNEEALAPANKITVAWTSWAGLDKKNVLRFTSLRFASLSCLPKQVSFLQTGDGFEQQRQFGFSVKA